VREAPTPNMDRIEFPRSFQLTICAVVTGVAGIVLNRRMIGTVIAILLFILAILNGRIQSKQPDENADEAYSPFDE
jgi:hypothetical protein